MAEMTASSMPAGSIHKTDEARRRQRRRYGAEWRFKIAGALAVLLATLALVSLLWTVFANAFGSLRETYLRLPVKLERAALDLPEGELDAQQIRGGNFNGIVKAALRESVPSVKGRTNRRALYSLASDGAALSLRASAMADPSLLGQTKEVQLLASDDVDLWVKGYVDRIEKLASPGNATPQQIGENYRIVVEANAFQSIVTTIKDALHENAQRLRRQAEAQMRGVTVYGRRIANADSDKVKQDLQAELEGYKQRATDLQKQARLFDERANAPGGTESLNSSLPSYFLRINGGVIKIENASGDVVEGPAILPLQNTDTAASGTWELLQIAGSEEGRRINDRQAIWLDKLDQDGRISREINWNFFQDSNSREAELAGVWGAIVGSFWTMLVTFLLAFPIGVMAAIYLEEFAPKNIITDFIEVNINNLAAVPSIVFGLLGLGVFIGFFGVPRSTALAGGIVLALMTLPTIIIAARAAIKAVPPSIRQAALGVGASKVQTVSHHVLPLAMPGILTGTIIGMAQALGETAPLLMIGMFAFIREIPGGITEPATALPVQIYQWSDFPERLFEMKTAAAIVVLLIFLIIMNLIAIVLRKRFERRW
ncbi:MAG: phosphate ABC transporter permease PstA [Hyphomicrobiaceae bacterium]